MLKTSQDLGMTLNFTIVEEPNFRDGETLHACIIGPLPNENTADCVLKLEYFASTIPATYTGIRQSSLSTLLTTIAGGSMPWDNMLPTSDVDNYGNVYHFYLNEDMSIDGEYYFKHLNSETPTGKPKPSSADEPSQKKSKTEQN